MPIPVLIRSLPTWLRAAQQHNMGRFFVPRRFGIEVGKDMAQGLGLGVAAGAVFMWYHRYVNRRTADFYAQYNVELAKHTAAHFESRQAAEEEEE